MRIQSLAESVQRLCQSPWLVAVFAAVFVVVMVILDVLSAELRREAFFVDRLKIYLIMAMVAGLGVMALWVMWKEFV